MDYNMSAKTVRSRRLLKLPIISFHFHLLFSREVDLYSGISNDSTMSDRKGITPVVSVVLLMMVTVGAVGVVYTQFNALASNEKGLDELNQDTGISIVRLESTGGHTAGDNGGYVNLTITNTGEVTRNTTAFTLTVMDGPDDATDSHCFKPRHSKIIDPAADFPANTYVCNTTVPFPNPTQSVKFRVGLVGSGKDWTKRCSPRLTSSTVCS